MADPVSRDHETPPGHPEQSGRFDAVLRGLRYAKLLDRLPRIESRAATDDELALCHAREYIELVKNEIGHGASMLSTGDTDVGRDSLEVARRAAGGVLNAVDAVFAGTVHNAFCVVRPPGHHATPSRAMGFCIFNNVAIAARYAQRKYGAERVVIADWDVHHGNGTQDIFYRDGTVLFFSTHQSPWYPGTGASNETGEGKGSGLIRNCPFPASAGPVEILGAFREILLPAAHEFRPDLVLLSTGFDSRAGDPLGRFRLQDQDFAELTAMMLDLADRHAGGRLVSVLEGGYDLDGLAAAAAAHVEALAGEKLMRNRPKDDTL